MTQIIPSPTQVCPECKKTHCKHYESDFDRYCKENPITYQRIIRCKIDMNKDKIKEETIDSLAMALTHSEQGEYAKNGAYVTLKINSLLAHLSAQYEKLIEECLPPVENTLEEVAELNKDLPSTLQEESYHYSRGWLAALSTIRASLQERGIKIK